MLPTETMSLDIVPIDPVRIRQDFPVLNQTIHNNRSLIYFDNGASTQRPRQVIQSMVDCYERTYANVHRGIHYLSEQASDQYEQARNKVAHLIGAQQPSEIIFTSGTTAAINLVSNSWGTVNVGAGDEILLTMMEHHSNIVPWQQLAERTGAKIRFVGLTDDGQLNLPEFQKMLTEKTRMVSFCAVSNVLGTINPVREITEMAQQNGSLVFIDAAQHVPHDETDVAEWGADFICFSGHKMLGPSGIGVLYGREDLLERMPPFLGGGSMISEVTTGGYVPGELPAKFEAGTPPIAPAIGLASAIEYLDQFGMNAILQHEQNLAAVAMQRLRETEGLKILGPSADLRAGIVSFTIEGIATQDLALLLDRRGVAIRSGHHCAMPLHDYLGIANSCRASFYLYNSEEEVEQFSEHLSHVIRKLR